MRSVKWPLQAFTDVLSDSTNGWIMMLDSFICGVSVCVGASWRSSPGSTGYKCPWSGYWPKREHSIQYELQLIRLHLFFFFFLSPAQPMVQDSLHLLQIIDPESNLGGEGEGPDVCKQNLNSSID